MNSGDTIAILFSIDTNVILNPMLEFNLEELTFAIIDVYIVDSPATIITVYSLQPFH
jgi:hypothetical protein